MEFAAPMTLTTPYGTLTFNAASGDAYHLSDVSGLDMPAVRSVSEPLPQRHGVSVYDSYLGARSITLSGQVVPANGAVATRRAMFDTLAAYLTSIRRADGTLKWLPSGESVYRRATVRLQEPLTVRGTWLKDFTVGLISGDGLIEADAVNTLDSGHLASGTVTLSVTNAGNAAVYPKLRVYGAIANPVITNDTTTKEFWLAYTVAAGQWVEIDTKPGVETIVRDNGLNLADKLNISTLTELWTLEPGVNVTRLTGTAPDGVEKLRVVWRDGWA